MILRWGRGLAAGWMPVAMLCERSPRATKFDRSTSSTLLIVLLFVMMTSRAVAAPLREIPSQDEPLSIQDGYIPYSVGNGSMADEAKKSFYQLVGMEIPGPQGIGPPIEIPTKPKKERHRRPGSLGRKGTLSGRKEAFLLLADHMRSESKEQRCDGQKFKQRVKVPGCLTKTIINRFCHGACSSYFIPRMSSKKLKVSLSVLFLNSSHSARNQAVFKSCAACGPKEYDKVEVTLDCPGQPLPQVTRTVIKVKKCDCINVDLNS